MRNSTVAVLLVLLFVTHTAIAQTDVFGSSDTIRIIEPLDGASSTAGGSIPISVELHHDWEFEEVWVWVGGRLINTFSPDKLIQFEFEPSEDQIGNLEIMALAFLGGENQGYSFMARSTVTVLPSQLPISLKVDRQDIRLSPDARYEERIWVRATFSDGSTQTVSQQRLGVSFEPLSPGIVAIAEDGRITVLAEGETLVRISYKGLEDWAYVAVYDHSDSPLPYPAPRNITSEIIIDIGPFRRDTKLNRFSQTITLTSASKLPIPHPIIVVFADLPDGVIVSSDRAGISFALEPKGSPLFLPGSWPNDLIMPGDSVSFDVEFQTSRDSVPVYRPIVYNSGIY